MIKSVTRFLLTGQFGEPKKSESELHEEELLSAIRSKHINDLKSVLEKGSPTISQKALREAKDKPEYLKLLVAQSDPTDVLFLFSNKKSIFDCSDILCTFCYQAATTYKAVQGGLEENSNQPEARRISHQIRAKV